MTHTPDTDKPIMLIIDGDVVAFIAAAASERAVQDEIGNVTYHYFADEGIAVAAGLISKWRNQLANAVPSAALTIVVALSDPHENWRYEVASTYKGNRKAGDMTRVPLGLAPLKQWLRDEYAATHMSRLEADDMISLLMTDPRLEDFHRIAVGRDKDFKSIPGWHYQHHQGDRNEDIVPFFITPPEADRWHLMQSLAGDRTDGFEGCPGIGIKRAATLIDECMLQVPGEGVITRGVNKGSKVVRWSQVPAANHWECIVSHYEKHGLSEVDALATARMAHLLRYGEYNELTGEVKLWQPHQSL